MKIHRFSKAINKHLQNYYLNNSTVVIDGLNYFHDLYKDNKIPFVWGPESNLYANHLRRHLRKFQESNVKCYFIFKGGFDEFNVTYKCKEHRDDYHNEPRFTIDICRQVLDEMGFDYVVCEKQCKTECIALAQKLSCPIISFDIEFCFSGVDYIPYKRCGTDSLVYNESSHNLTCGIFKLNDFLKTLHLSKEMLAIFIVLTDESGLKTDIFLNFFDDLKISFMDFHRNDMLLSRLSNKTTIGVTKEIFKHLSIQNQNDFLGAKESIITLMENKPEPGLPSAYLLNNKKLKIAEMDPLWFLKGIVLNHIPRWYIDVFNYQAIVPSYNTNNKTCHPENSTNGKISLFICFEIIKYAFDLLTNFSGASISLIYKNCCKRYGNKDILINYSIPKPTYFAKVCVFENGWQNIKQLKLFEHFITNTLPGFDFNFLDKAPESAQLLIIVLVYFTQKKSKNSINIDVEVSGIMLSYILLKFVSPPKGKCTLIPQQDCAMARSVLNKYLFGIKDSHLKNGPCFCLYDFQDCLEQLNYLNVLCGRPFVPTIYSETYNATFVYNCTAKNLTKLEFKKMLLGAPIVSELYIDLLQIYEGILDNMTA